MHTFFCPECSARVQVVEKAAHDTGQNCYGWRALYVFGHCPQCEHAAVMQTTEDGPNQWSEPEQVYPASAGQPHKGLPERVAESYREALKCEQVRAWLALAVMVRRTLEAIGREFDPKAKTLAAGLETLHQQGVISDELSQWGHGLRFLGNVGAHPTGEKIGEDDGRDALEFLRAIIETIYHLRPKFQEMQQRRQAAKAPAGNTAGGDT